MRILHTSDWHIGLQTGHFSRREDHEAFFRWLTRTLAEHQIDALIVAGDVFDGMQPSNESLRLYYRFLRDLGTTGVRDVVVVGGNHDSPAQLDAPREVLAALSVHVTGGYSGETDPKRYLAPLRARNSDAPAAVCIALPYIHEYRLGIRTTDCDRDATRRMFIERFRSLYAEMTSLAAQEYPGLPLIATGHLAMGKLEAGDAPQEIHQVGLIDALPADVIDPRLGYVALGHIHRAFPVERDRIWYSGSPIPVSLVEARRPRQVLIVELPNAHPEHGEPGDSVQVSAITSARVTQLEVPVARELLEYEGTEQEIIDFLSNLECRAELPALLYLRAQLSAPEPQLTAKIRAALDRFSPDRRPLLVELRELLEGASAEQEPFEALSLEDLTPRQVFLRLCSQRQVDPTAELLHAFEFVATAQREELDASMAAITLSGSNGNLQSAKPEGAR